MSLLRDIQASAIDSRTKLSDLLRQCKVLAARLGNEDFKRWVDQELSGYRSKEGIPEYRILNVNSYGHFMGPFRSEMRNALIPPLVLPEEFREIASTAYIMEPVSALAETLEHSKEGDDLRSSWPADMVADVGTKVTIYTDLACVSAWRLIPRGSLVTILETVRNRILNFVLEIEADAPDAGETPPNLTPVSQERVTQIYQTHITGGVQSLAVGSRDVTQVSVMQVRQGDLDSLKKYLSGLGVPDLDLQELEGALAEDASQGKIGGRTSGWIGRMIEKASSGAWEVTTSAAASMLTRAVSLYLGLPF